MLQPKHEGNRKAEAETAKELGNVAFREKRYEAAIDLYSQAIGVDFLDVRVIALNSLGNADHHPEPTYYTNRAASYMAVKHFRPALDDCQQAATLQYASPQPKTLIRLARCQLALGSPSLAILSINSALELDLKNAPALQLRQQIQQLQDHLRNFQAAKGRQEWGMARLALDKCFQCIDAEGGDTPTQWRLWRIELDLARGSWDSAQSAAKLDSPDSCLYHHLTS
jgi:DnaJ homolog subfamily C member 7